MVTLQEVESQFKAIGFNFRAWGRGEVKELCKILADGETIKQCANGYYQNGFAMLVATNQRLLLVDRKPLFLTLEAIWYDKIGQIDFYHRMLNATICISSPNKDLNFTSWSHGRLRQILAFSQQKMMAAKAGEALEEGERRAETSMERVRPRNSLWWLGGNQGTNKKSLRPTQMEAVQQLPNQEIVTNINEQSAVPSVKETTIPPIPLPEYPSASGNKLKLYAATRLPFSRRRYFVR